MRVLRFSALCAALAATFGSLQAQSVPQRIEYFFDTDPGHGKATAVQSVKAGDNQLTFSTAGLQEGAHVLYVRSQDNNGAWSATTARPLFVIKKRPTGVRSLEYFLDTDPGYGKATRATIGGEGATLLLEPNTTETGAHVLHLRAQDDRGNWSPVFVRTLYVCSPHRFNALEYFFDSNDPGTGKAVRVKLSTQADTPTGTFVFDIPTDELPAGEHQFNLRARFPDGTWTLTRSEPFTITKNGTGVAQIEWLLPVSIQTTNTSCVLTSRSSKGDCRVELFSTQGILLASAQWKADDSQITLPLHNPKGQILLVQVTELQSGRRTTRRIVCR